MKAISLWEPWASLIRTGAKTWETRAWPTEYRGRLLICAAKGGLPRTEVRELIWMKLFQCGLRPLVGKPICHDSESIRSIHVDLCDLNFGMAVALVEILDCWRTEDVDIELDSTGMEKHYGDFSPNRYAWELKLIDGSFPPFPITGKQGFFTVPDEAIQEHIRTHA
jgi:hypothetical protein